MALSDLNFIPFFHIAFEVGSSNLVNENVPVLLGQKLSTGSATAGTLIPVANGQEDVLFGKGSMLSYMVRKFRKNSPATTPYVIPLADPTGAFSTATITISTATATVAETLQLNILDYGLDGNVVNVTVDVGDTNAEVATAIAAAINADTSLLVTATASTNVVTVTTRHKGVLFNGLTIDTIGTPALTIAFTAFANGTGAIDLTGVLDVLPENGTSYNIGTPYNDNTNLTIVKNYYSNVDGAWSDLIQSYGHGLTVKNLSFSSAISDAENHNSEHLTILNPKGIYTPVFGIVSAFLGWHNEKLTSRATLSLPEHGDILYGVHLKSSFTTPEKVELAKKNIGILEQGRTGETQLVRAFTTYKYDSFGSPNSSYRDIQTMAQLQYLAKDLQNVLQSRFGKSILNNQVVKDVRDAIVLRIIDLCSNTQQGVILENQEVMIKALQVVRSNIAGRVDIRFSADMVDALRQANTTIKTYDNIL